MPIAMTTAGVHHIALRSTDLARSRRFYAKTLGFPVVLDVDGMFLFLAGSTAVAVRGPEPQTPAGDVFSPFRAGLDHLALACGDERELQRVAAALTSAGVENTGVKLDPALNRRYVAFKDPDRIAWEFYMAPNGTLTESAAEAAR
ncbi:MAG TPA: VOC family protein [Vicinamibacterales bacterium]|jgi:glyoxylase I family protein|nr:VOC family protein [Vicinamibacterales bacterium]